MRARYDKQKEIASESSEARPWGWHGQEYSCQAQPSQLPDTVRPNVGQGFLQGGFHLFGGRLRGDLRGHVVQMLRKILGVPVALTFEGMRHDMGKVALGQHTSGARLLFK